MSSIIKFHEFKNMLQIINPSYFTRNNKLEKTLKSNF